MLISLAYTDDFERAANDEGFTLDRSYVLKLLIGARKDLVDEED